MLENEELLVKIMEEKNLVCVLHVEEKQYHVHSMSIAKSKIPVREPTTRGGVYFTDVEAFKIKAKIMDLSIKKEIPKLMLGPNTEFKSILIKTTLKIEEKVHLVTMTTHLTNAVSTKEMIELNLLVDKIDSE